jgi:hypothetical protein
LATAARVIPLLKDTAVEVNLDIDSTSVVQLLLSHRVADFSWYKIPKRGEIYLPNGHKIYQNGHKNFQWP